ncbi:imidazolonepropionase [Maritalea porphyrae]|uniref:Imidazolonepropionase n=1 Tax=Maritalea porphyrae TaxID=880732 RepID=A0ABQ5UQC0_9HYPH|nr:imidazolonepropionase [Maritalea porphyrae]GLQ16990.1 imidazolonepropionase [Maritalea porphyrae]
MSNSANYLLINTSIATMHDVNARYGGLIENGAIAIEGEKVVWVGPADQVPTEFEGWDKRDLGGALVTPGLIDCHTHLVYGGNRANEFEMRLDGASYEEVARAGGGILSTVNATRAASVEELVAMALPRLDALLAEGVTTVEIKSGYGLDLATERNMLLAARKLAELRPINIKTTFLGAHATSPEFKGRDDDYVQHVAKEMLPALAAEGLVDAVDGFCEGIAFSLAQMQVVFDAAQKLGLPIKLHAEQLSNLGGAAMAAANGALSADHLEYLEEDGVKALAKSDTAAVLLPGAFYTLRETQLPPIELLRQHKVNIAIATDSNPGSSPLTSLLLTMNMAATLFRMTPEEALRGVTINAAKALGLDKNTGSIAVGKRADLAVWDVKSPAELTYRIGFNPIKFSIFGGILRD